jgi:hypothetical protein
MIGRINQIEVTRGASGTLLLLHCRPGHTDSHPGVGVKVLLLQRLRAKSTGAQRRRGSSGRGGRSMCEHRGADGVTLMCPML